MGDMDHAPAPPPPPPATAEQCYRHPGVQTGVHCTRCGRPICPDCMIPAPVGHQCPECVHGAKQDFRRPAARVSIGPRTGFTVTNALLAVLVVIFVGEVAYAGPNSLLSGPTNGQLIRMGGDVGIAVAAGQVWRLFTSMFLHIGIFHILMNGYALYLFGNVVEAEQGSRRLVVLYLVTGLCASATSYAFGSPVAVGAGASGAIFGIFGVFLGYSWRRRDLAFYAARVRSALWLIAINAFIAFTIPSIDWRAHLGGLVAGLVIGAASDGIVTLPKRYGFALGIGVVAAATVALVVFRTDQLQPLVQFWPQVARRFGAG
jgi:membrane associated rhomboid family serine protease